MSASSSAARSQLLEVVAPYERFLETERTELEGGLTSLRDAPREGQVWSAGSPKLFAKPTESGRVAW